MLESALMKYIKLNLVKYCKVDNIFTPTYKLHYNHFIIKYKKKLWSVKHAMMYMFNLKKVYSWKKVKMILDGIIGL